MTLHIFLSIILILFFPSQVANAPPGTQACTFDIEKFHRTCPVLPAHKPWLVVQGLSNDFYYDHAHPFGAAAASSNAGMIGNAIVDIWQAEGVKPILKYEDDLKIFRYPVTAGNFHQDGFQYHYDREEALSRISSLHVPWHKDKGDLAFSYITNFIGFRWDLPSRHVSLPEDKRLKFTTESASSWIASPAIPVHYLISKKFTVLYAMSLLSTHRATPAFPHFPTS